MIFRYFTSFRFESLNLTTNVVIPNSGKACQVFKYCNLASVPSRLLNAACASRIRSVN
jgi:hypothetical protein